MPPIAPAPVNYYSMLGVAPSADVASINAAFRRLAWRYHPDRNPSPDATVQFQNVNEARHVLSDPVRRARYDCTWHIQSGGYGQVAWIPSRSRHHRKRIRRCPLRMVTLIVSSGLLVTSLWAALLFSLMQPHSSLPMFESTPEFDSAPSTYSLSSKALFISRDGSYGDVAVACNPSADSRRGVSTYILDPPDLGRSLSSEMINVYAGYYCAQSDVSAYRVEYE
jgi:hypothetical protein